MSIVLLGPDNNVHLQAERTERRLVRAEEFDEVMAALLDAKFI